MHYLTRFNKPRENYRITFEILGI